LNREVLSGNPQETVQVSQKERESVDPKGNQRDHVSSGTGGLRGEGHNEDIEQLEADLSFGCPLKTARVEADKGDNDDGYLASWWCLIAIVRFSESHDMVRR
jgi:hypothetical protein